MTFAAKTERVGECLLWTAAKSSDGYGAAQHRGRTLRAHRVAWELANGPIPDGMHVLHTCDVRACVNVLHLFLGTNADNVADKKAKGRQAQGPAHAAATAGRRPRGASHGMAKLDPEKVAEVRRRIAAGDTKASIARDMGVTRPAIWAVATGRTWA